MSHASDEAVITVSEPARLTGRLVEHMALHDIPVETVDGVSTVQTPFGRGVLNPSSGALHIRLDAKDQAGLETMRAFLASHILEFAEDEAVLVRWRGGVAVGATPTDFRIARLKSAIDLTPRMRRLTFAGADFARFDNPNELHVRLYFPPAGLKEPEWPRLGVDGRIVWPPDDRRPSTRYYTIRRIDAERGEIEIDFVIHADAGPGSIFAEEARPGAVCGVAGPLGRSIRPSKRYLLAGDETALPAIARILETLPRNSAGSAYVEIADERERADIRKPEGFDLHWLIRDGAAPGTTDLLGDAVKASPELTRSDLFVWAACEAKTAEAVRNHLRSAIGLPREQHLVVAYWRRGGGARR